MANKPHTALPTATQIGGRIAGMSGDARLYQLSEPLDGNVHVVVSGISNEWGTETYIFGADASGEITNWGELFGSFKGDIDHEAALRGAGYEVTA